MLALVSFLLFYQFEGASSLISPKTQGLRRQRIWSVVENRPTSLSDKDQLDRPRWAAGGFLSNTVNALIANKSLFGLMKIGARKSMISTAEKNGIPWDSRAKELLNNQKKLEEYYSSVVDDKISYPEYYTQEFHAYSEGNLNWQAAVECESATMSIALRVWPKESLTASQAQDRWRNSFTNTIKDYIKSNNLRSINNILDVGCSVGISTFYVHDAFPAAKVIDGLDLSPHFLSIAKYRQNAEGEKYKKIRWLHRNVESSGIKSNTYDLTAVSFMFHELPKEPSDAILKELFRVTKPGGVVAITDNNPSSPVIQNLPPVLFTLMKSTEPWSDEYYVYNIEEAMRSTGFKNIETVASDPRHRTILATKPFDLMTFWK